MILHLLRHAEAEDRSLSGRDADRRLTSDGVRRMERVAKAIATLEPDYEAVFVSTLVRARQTAEPVAEACGFRKPFVETTALVPSADPEEILHEVARAVSRGGTALLVGHEPHMGRLFGRLLSGRHDVGAPMKKASLAAFACTGDPSAGLSELRFLLPAKLLERLA